MSKKLEPINIDVLKNYWNHVITPYEGKIFQSHISEGTLEKTNTNILDFVNMNNKKIVHITELSTPVAEFTKENDIIADSILRYVHDTIQYKIVEWDTWQFADETIKRKMGDCEDGSILMYNMMIKNGIPYWRVRLNCGKTPDGGHCWVTYLSEVDDKWYILDWCYHYKECTNFQKRWTFAGEQYSEIWFSWNMKYVYKLNNVSLDLDRFHIT